MESEINKENNNYLIIGLVVSMFCWGLSWTSGKVLAMYGNPLTISLIRFLFSFISLFVFLLIKKEKLIISKKGLFILLAASLVITLYFYLFLFGLYYGKPGAGGILVTTLNPIISYALVLLVAFRKPTNKEMLGLGLGLIAGIILLKLWDDPKSILNESIIYFVLASITWAVLSLFTSKSSRYGSPLSFSLWMYAIGSLFMLLITNQKENLRVVSEADAVFWWNMFFSGTLTTAIATTIYFVATTKLGAGRASSFIFLVPLSAALGAWLFLDEIPTVHSIIGGVLGIGAVYILNKK